MQLCLRCCGFSSPVLHNNIFIHRRRRRRDTVDYLIARTHARSHAQIEMLACCLANVRARARGAIVLLRRAYRTLPLRRRRLRMCACFSIRAIHENVPRTYDDFDFIHENTYNVILSCAAAQRQRRVICCLIAHSFNFSACALDEAAPHVSDAVGGAASSLSESSVCCSL